MYVQSLCKTKISTINAFRFVLSLLSNEKVGGNIGITFNRHGCCKNRRIYFFSVRIISGLNRSCFNRGIYQPVCSSYECMSLSNSHSDLHCGHIATLIRIKQAVARSFASFAIIAISGLMIFVVVLDIMRYIVQIDFTRHHSNSFQMKRKLKKMKSEPITKASDCRPIRVY